MVLIATVKGTMLSTEFKKFAIMWNGHINLMSNINMHMEQGVS